MGGSKSKNQGEPSERLKNQSKRSERSKYKGRWLTNSVKNDRFTEINAAFYTLILASDGSIAEVAGTTDASGFVS